MRCGWRGVEERQGEQRERRGRGDERSSLMHTTEGEKKTRESKSRLLKRKKVEEQG